MIDLLKRFVELAPKEWGVYQDDDHWVNFCQILSDYAASEKEDWEIGFLLTDDRASAEAIIFLWDYLGESYLLRWFDGKGWVCSLAPQSAPDNRGCPTRIEALVRACVAYWRNNDG